MTKSRLVRAFNLSIELGEMGYDSIVKESGCCVDVSIKLGKSDHYHTAIIRFFWSETCDVIEERPEMLLSMQGRGYDNCHEMPDDWFIPENDLDLYYKLDLDQQVCKRYSNP